MPVGLGTTVKKVHQAVDQQTQHHDPLTAIAVDDRPSQDGSRQPGYGVNGHQTGDGCVW